MKKIIVRIGTLVSIVAMILIGLTGIVAAEITEVDCPTNTDRLSTNVAYVYSSLSGNTMTYYIDTTNKPGSSIKEYCVYPTPGFSGSTSDLTVLYSGWEIDFPVPQPYFGFDSKNGPLLPLNGNTNIPVGEAIYASGVPDSQLILLHVMDTEECGGQTDGCWRIPQMAPMPNIPPIANPNGPYSGIKGNVINFDGSASSDPDGSIISYSWNFGDGGTGTGAIPSHVYIQNGTYTVSLTVTDNSGLTNTNTTTAIIIDTTPTVTSTPPGDRQPPTQPLCPVALATGPTTINFSWSPSTDNVGVAGYKVYRSVDNINFYLITTTTNTYYHDSGLTTGTTYYYAVEAFDTSGNPSLPSDVTYATPRDIQDPIVTAPSDMTVEATSASGAIVTFIVTATDDIDPNPTIDCSHSSGSQFPLGFTTVTCTATDNSGNIGSNVFVVNVVDTIPPTDPSGLTATAKSTSRIDLSWTASTDAVGVTQYRIYRSLDGISFTGIATVSGITTTYQNNGLAPNTTYYYYVVAYDRVGHFSGNSNTVSATTFVIPPTPPPTGTPTPGPTGTPGPTPTPPIVDMPPIVTVPLDITAEATSASGATVTFSSFVSAYDNEDGESKPVTCNPISSSTFVLGMTIVECQASDSAGNIGSSTFTVTVVDTTPPTSPSGLTATASSTSRIDLSWTASTDAVGVTQYDIYRSLNEINFINIRTVSGATTTIQNNGLMSNTTYYYYVVASDRAGNPSGHSNTASATTFIQPPNPPPTPGPTPGPTSTPGPTPTDTPNPCIPLTGNTPRGYDITTEPASTIDVKFDAVLGCGDTTAVAYYDSQWGAIPDNYTSQLYYNIDTTATYTDYITIDITYSQSDIPTGVDEQTLRMFHYENGAWVDVTIALDTTANRITGRVSSLSPFSIGGMTGSGGGGGGGGGGGSGVLRGSSLDSIGIIMLGICLIFVSIIRIRKKR